MSQKTETKKETVPPAPKERVTLGQLLGDFKGLLVGSVRFLFHFLGWFWRGVLMSAWFNFGIFVLVCLAYAAVPFLWLHHYKIPFEIKPPDSPEATSLASFAWGVFLCLQTCYWFIYYPHRKMTESSDSNKQGPRDARPAEEAKVEKHAAAHAAKPAERALSKQGEELLRRFKTCVQSMGSSRLQFETGSLEKSLRTDTDPSLRLVYKLEKPDAHSAIIQLTEDGRVICKDVDKLRLAQPIALACEVSLAPGMEAGLEPGDLAQLKPQRFTVDIRVHLAEAEVHFLAWANAASKTSRMPNAKQGVAYSVSLRDVLSLNPEFVSLVSVDTGASGLTWRPDGLMLEGQVAVGNNHRILVTAACSLAPSLRREIAMLLTCTMDPEVEWLRIQQERGDEAAKLEVDVAEKLERAASAIRNAEGEHPLVPHPRADFGKPHRVRRSMQVGDLRLGYASVRGRSHIKDDKFREDHAGATAFCGNRALAVVVSDGAGSASLSRRGSEIVVHVALAGMREIGEAIVADPSLVGGEDSAWLHSQFAALVQGIKDRISFESEIVRSALPSFADKGMYATFLGALILPSAEGHLVLSYAIGDGAIGVGLAPAGGAGLKSSPDHGESAGQTLFVLSKGADDAAKRLRVDRISGAFTLMLMTDGVTDPLLSGEDVVTAARWDALATELASLGEEPLTEGEVVAGQPFSPMIKWLEAYHKGHHDDRTIACVTHKIS